MACAPSHIDTPNLGGRPRMHDRNQIAKDLIEWAKLDDSINLNAFCCSREPFINPRKISEWAKEDDWFKEAYETAKAFIGARRERKLNTNQLHVKAYDLNATVYDHFLKEEKRQQAEFESNLKKQEEGSKQTTYNIMVPHDLAIGANLPASAISNKDTTST